MRRIIEIPPTAVGGLFRSFLQRNLARATLKSHQRQLVDCSVVVATLHGALELLFNTVLSLLRELPNLFAI